MIVTSKEGEGRVPVAQALKDPNLDVRYIAHFNDRYFEAFAKDREAQDYLQKRQKELPGVKFRPEVEDLRDYGDIKSPHFLSTQMEAMVERLKKSAEFRRMTTGERNAWAHRMFTE